MTPTAINEQVSHETDKLSLKRFQWLTFPEPLEARFEDDTFVYRGTRLWIEGLLGITFFNLFLIANHLFLQTVPWKTVLVRSGLVTPLALVVNFTVRRNFGGVYREFSIASVLCWACFTHLYLESGPTALGAVYAQIGVIVAVLFTNVVMRLRFPYAFASTLAMMAADLVFLNYNKTQTTAESILGGSLTITAMAMTLMANYSLGREERLGYLLRVSGEIQSAALSTSNQELQRISSTDALTGLANRHHFGDQYLKLWKQALVTRAPLSAILIDIDHFKAVNDVNGHLYGDQVLKRVAMLVQQSLRGKGDFVARFGGEEFVVLLPGTNPEAAMMVAERIRKLVEVAGSPAVEFVPDYPSVWTTVSCGVATCWPTHTDPSDDLLSAADKALYESKESGRNRVSYGETALKRS